MKIPMHGANLKYTPFEFDDTSIEQIAAALEKNAEIMQMKNIASTIHSMDWMNKSQNVHCNRIIGWSEYYGNMLTPYHNHTFFEINYVIKGNLVQNIDGKTHIMHEGDLLFLPPEVYHISYPTRNSFCVNVIFTNEFITSTCDIISKHVHTNYLKNIIKNHIYLMFNTLDIPEIDSAIREIFDLFDNKKSRESRISSLLAENLGTQLLLRLEECERLDHAYSQNKTVESTKDKTERILQYINNNYATVTIEDVSRVFGYSPQHIRRMVLKVTGQNFKFYVMNCKLKKADYFVTKTNYPIKDIAAMIGFAPEYFSRKYKYERGCSPEEYRRMMKTKNKSDDDY